MRGETEAKQSSIKEECFWSRQIKAFMGFHKNYLSRSERADNRGGKHIRFP